MSFAFLFMYLGRQNRTKLLLKLTLNIIYLNSFHVQTPVLSDYQVNIMESSSISRSIFFRLSGSEWSWSLSQLKARVRVQNKIYQLEKMLL